MPLRQFRLLVANTAFGCLSFAFADDTQTNQALSPLASTLPDRTARVRLIHKTLTGSSGFGESGNSMNQGVKVTGNGIGVGADIAVNRNITFGIGIPIVYSNHAQMDAKIFEQSDEYSYIYKTERKQIAQKLVDIGTCSSVDVCIQRIERGESLPIEAKLRMPDTNELVVLPAGVSLKDAVRSLILNGATQSDGSVGMGDLQTGLRIRLAEFSEYRPVQVAMQLGVTLPTGKYTKAPTSERPTGRGFVEPNLGISSDYRVNSSWILSGSYLAEIALTDIKRQKSLILDNKTLGSGQCDAVGQGNNWDGQCVVSSPNGVEKRNGIKQTVVGQTTFALEEISPALKLWGVGVGLQYERDSVLVSDGEEKPQQSLLTLKTMVTLTGLNANPLIPLETNLEFDIPLAGTNQVVTPYSVTLNCYGFMQW